MGNNEMIMPFYSGSTYREWKSRNCHNCKKYEEESGCLEEAGCSIAFYIDYGSVASEAVMPLSEAEKVGIKERKGEYAFLVDDCKFLEENEDD